MLRKGSIVDDTIFSAPSSTIKFDGSNGFELVALYGIKQFALA